jgi:AraC-like DNA-binding protein
MSIFYLEEHQSCGNYISDFNVGFQSYHIKKGEQFMPANRRDYHCIIFMIEGSARLVYNAKLYGFENDTMCFIPVSSDYKIIAETDIVCIINYFNNPVSLCKKGMLENLSAYLDDAPYDPTVKINSAIKQFLDSIDFYIKHGAKCRHFHEIKHQELLFNLRYFYSKQDLARLFAPITGNYFDFRDNVLKNCIRARTVKELAESCNCSVPSFNRLFKSNFGDSPYRWLQNRKMKHIVSRLSDMNTPLVNIIDEFGFSSPSHFTVFCKKYLNKTPSQFRRELHY